ncbi:MAG: hypothetical protein Q7J34_05790 [Bacteroidales bacterium]|nr:hypothetical protein [Bacteroidales bacterium]
MTEFPKVFVCLPVMQEEAYLEAITNSLKHQDYPDVQLVICINQPESYRHIPEKKHICIENEKALKYFRKEFPNAIIIDRASQGIGWDDKFYGVGWARKVCLDEASSMAYPSDILLSMDADTEYPKDYITKVVHGFSMHPQALGMAIPYYHKQTPNEEANKAILRYEIYMRYFAVNMLRTGQYYAFTAIGSAMACTGKAYKKIRGLTPHKSGEDFYFLQKLRKSGSIIIWADTLAWPAARFSDRVFFGTGPAMIKGSSGNWDSYPIYPARFFDEVATTIQLFPILFENDQPTPMDDFLNSTYGDSKFWQKIRKSCKTEKRFIQACHESIDGLKILQFLRYRLNQEFSEDYSNLQTFFNDNFQNFLPDSEFSGNFYTLVGLDYIRELLFNIEFSERNRIRILK